VSLGCHFLGARDPPGGLLPGRAADEMPSALTTGDARLSACGRPPGRLSSARILERWPRGRRRRFAKPLYGPKAVSRVRIPPPPQVLPVRVAFSRRDSPAKGRRLVAT